MNDAMAAGLILVTGGARSGKSSFAQSLAQGRQARTVFIATARADDDEMRARIENHRRLRPAGWHTIEEPCRISDAVGSCEGVYDVVLIDCMALWISNLLHEGWDEAGIEREAGRLVETAQTVTAQVIIVSNETGMGIVPDNRLSRSFRDILGRTNQEIASAADEVFFLVAGIPLRLKGKPSPASPDSGIHYENNR